MKSKEFITELFSAPLEYQWGDKKGLNWWGSFLVPGSKPADKPLKVVLIFIPKPNSSPTIVDVTFSVDFRHELTGGGHALEIFSTIGKMFDEYLTNVSPEVLRFSADGKEPSRVKLYNRLATGLAKKYGYTLETKPINGDIYFHLIKQ